MRKKRVLLHSDSAAVKTGFGRVVKSILKFLETTKKYEIHHLCCGTRDDLPFLEITPWKSYGTIPGSTQGNVERHISYGSAAVDKMIEQIKPDVYIGMQDFWGLDYSVEKKWFNNITSCIWTTLDSLPLLKDAVKKVPKIKNFWVWSNFAEKEMHKIGNKHVKTMHGPIETSFFYRLEKGERLKLRNKFSLPEDATIIGFVFRNQLRKLVPNLFEGYKKWKDRNPELKNTYLLLHTNLSEGWKIPEQADRVGIKHEEILCTYVCSKCGEYEVKSYHDDEAVFAKNSNGEFQKDTKGSKIKKEKPDFQNKNCPYCESANCQNTVNISTGVTEEQLNEVYNLMDVYTHPFTSGGQEIPIQEAKLTELITLVTNYSCGEECCEKDAHSLPLDWDKYFEHGTEFIKASTKPESIADKLYEFMKMSEEEKDRKGKLARKWALDGFRIEAIGAKIIDFIDGAPLLDEKDEKLFYAKERNPLSNPNGKVEESESDEEWVKSLYKNILGRDEPDEGGFNYWVNCLSSKTKSRLIIEKYFRSVAQKDAKEANESITLDKFFEYHITKNEKRKILFVMPKSIGDCFLSTAAISTLREMYEKENWDIYASSERQYKEIFHGNEDIEKWIPFHPVMENVMMMEGQGEHKGWFDICFTPHFSTQKTMSYIHNGLNKKLF